MTLYSGNPVSDRLTKGTIPKYGPPLASPKFFPIRYYQIQKGDRPASQDTDHSFSVSNHKKTKKQTTKRKNPLHFYSLLGETYTSTKGPAAAGFTNGTSYSWIHLWDKLWLHLLVGPAVTGYTNAWDQLSLNPLIGPSLQDPLRDQYWHNSLSMLSEPAVVGSNKGTSSVGIYKRDQLARSTKKTRAGWIHKSGQRWLEPLSSDWVT